MNIIIKNNFIYVDLFGDVGKIIYFIIGIIMFFVIVFNIIGVVLMLKSREFWKYS